jgi:Holliday junction DNA helicase RuvA
MVLELRDKLQAFSETRPTIPVSAIEEDVLSALVNLGYQRASAQQALATVSGNGKSGSFDVLFREALAGLSK